MRVVVGQPLPSFHKKKRKKKKKVVGGNYIKEKSTEKMKE
jgi:hypothetical protein